MKLIKVTSALAHNKGKEIYINTERILSITDEGDTRNIYMANGTETLIYRVEESLLNIISNTGN